MSRQAETVTLVEAYYDTFNQGDMPAFLAMLCDDVTHDINQGGRENGKETFKAFMEKMNRSYREQLKDIHIMATDCGTRAAAEFVVHGEYLSTDEGLPDANGQTYTLPAGAFFELRDGKVARIGSYYNLQDWLAQVGA